MEFEPHGLKEEAGSRLGVTERRVEADLKRFKAFIEKRKHETGAYRGEIIHGKATERPSHRQPTN
jgi:hypothetical protein